ncbi:MAG: hypothetical protein ACI4EF_08500, partial [Coprococcus sp.]
MNILFAFITCTLDAIALSLYFNGLFDSRKSKVPLPLFISAYVVMELLITIEPMLINLNSGFKEETVLMIWSTIITFLLTLLYNSIWRNRIFATISFQAIAFLSEDLIYITMPASRKYSMTVQADNVDTIWTCFAKILTLCIVIIIVHILKRRKLAYHYKYN